jgi:hypothetical protein
VGVGVSVGVPVGEGVAVGVSVGPVGVAVGVSVPVGDGVAVSVGVGVIVGVGVAPVGVAVGVEGLSNTCRWKSVDPTKMRPSLPIAGDDTRSSPVAYVQSNSPAEVSAYRLLSYEPA